MKSLSFVLLFSLSFAAAAKSDVLTAQEKVSLEASLKQKVSAETEIKELKDFKVNWKSLKCLRMKNEMEDGISYGVCHLDAHAFQVQVKAAVVKGQKGTEASLIFVNVE